MDKMIMILLLLLEIVSSVSCDLMVGHEIEVDQATGTDNSSCLLGDNPCATLNKALEGFKMNYSSTTIYVSPGNYTLEHGEVNNITDKDHIAIIGSGETNTIINCKPSAGLYISNCNSTIIESISFIACGYDANLDDLILNEQYTLKLKSSAVSLIQGSQIALDNVTIQFSNGTGLLLYNSTGPITINNSLIADGYGELPMILSHDRFVLEGGIVVISDDCFTCDNFGIANSKILNNNYSLICNNDDYTQPDCVSLSGGAALTLINPCYSNVNVNSCTIANNSRGFFIYSGSYETKYKYKDIFFGNTLDNIVYLYDCDPSVNRDYIIKFIDVNMTEYVSLISFNNAGSWDITLSNFLSNFIWTNNRNEYFPGQNHFQINVYSNDPICSESTCQTGHYYSGMCSGETGDCNCPSSYSMCFDNDQFNCLCFDNHADPYCGQCIEDHSVAINSPYLACVPCNDTMTVLKGWGLLIVLEFIPVTVMVAVIAVLNVNLNQGSLKAYIFLCQILTIPFPSVSYPSWFVVGYNFDLRIIDLAFLPFSIWNLGFINYPSCNFFDGSNHCNSMSICISPNTTPLGAIVFWYVIGFYPFLLLALSYACIIMYDRGCGCIVCVVRPVHRLLARFWRMFNIQPSLPHTIASVYTLCFTQLAATSLKLLTPSVSLEDSWNVVHFFYDGSQSYFSGLHCAAGIPALIVLIVFIVLPTVYLSLYPFKWFQAIFNKLRFKKDLLISITDVFTGPYKDGTDKNSWDCRYFTGLHFLLKLLIMCSYCLPYGLNNLPSNSIVICALSIIILLVFRPYKRNIHTFVELLVFICLTIFSVSSTSIVIYYLVEQINSEFSSLFIFPLDLIYGFIYVMYVLLLFVCCYCLFWFLKKSQTGIMYIYQLHSRPTAVSTLIHSDTKQYPDIYTNDDDNDTFADRVLNPQKYGTAQ